MNNSIPKQPSTPRVAPPTSDLSDEEMIEMREAGNLSPDGRKPVTTIPAKSGRKLRLIFFTIGALVLAVAVGGYYFRFLAPYESTDDASIECHVTAVAPQISGRVENVLVHDNQQVNEGDVLIEIDPRDFATKLSRARANLAEAQSQLAQAKAQFAVDEAKATQEHANIAAMEAQANYAQADWKRYQTIGNLGVSQSQIDLAETQSQSAGAQLEVARSKVLAAEAQAVLSQASIESASANIEQNESAVRQAELDLSYTKVTAPETGRVTRRTVEKGSFAQTGQALLSIVPHHIWVIANYKETQLENMRPGQPVEIEVDAYPHRQFTGHLDSIQTGSGARFSLFPPENATGNYIKVLQRVPVKIVFDETSLSDTNLVLGPGMSVEPKVRIK